MKSVMTKTLLAAALAAAMGVGSTSAMAALFNPFNVTETSVPGTVANIITNAGKITGNYTEVGTFNNDGTFAASIRWNAGQYVATDGATVLNSQLGGFTANQYQMYGLFQAVGTYVTVAGVTTFTMGPGGSLSLFIDPSSNTTFTPPGTGTGAWTTGSAGEDYLIATGTPYFGIGTLDPTLPTCTGGGGSGINCGSYGVNASFALTPDGKNYFTSPVPFYSLVFTSGQLNNFTPAGTQTINGSLDATFGVPEPESLALLGIGLLGLAMARRRGRKQA